jgi:hypothetical protein
MSSETPERPSGAEPPRVTFRGRPRPRRLYLGWPVLAALGAGVGFLTGSWPGLVVGGVLGYLAWRLR